MITTELIFCMRYSTHSEEFGKIIWSQNDCHTFYAIKFQGPKTTNLSLNPGCETSSTLPPNYSFEHASHRAVMLCGWLPHFLPNAVHAPVYTTHSSAVAAKQTAACLREMSAGHISGILISQKWVPVASPGYWFPGNEYPEDVGTLICKVWAPQACLSAQYWEWVPRAFPRTNFREMSVPDVSSALFQGI